MVDRTLYFAGDENRVFIVYLHGGAWMFGSNERTRPQCTVLHQLGYHVVSPSYTLARIPPDEARGLLWDAFPFLVAMSLLSEKPATWLAMVLFFSVLFWYMTWVDSSVRANPVDDVVRVIQDIHDRYRPSKVFLMGHSAGGNLATLAAQSSRVDGVIGISGVYNDNRLHLTRAGQRLSRIVFGESVDETRMPIYHVTEDTPPHYLITAQYDWDLLGHAFDYFATLQESGVPVLYRSYPGNHFSIVRRWTIESPIVKDIDAWIKQIAKEPAKI